MTSLCRTEIQNATPNGRFLFAEVVFRSQGTVELPLATPPVHVPIFVAIDIVDADIPALPGLDVLDGESLFAEAATSRLINRPVTSKDDEHLTYIDL